jgi:hypothetical protein
MFKGASEMKIRLSWLAHQKWQLPVKVYSMLVGAT